MLLEARAADGLSDEQVGRISLIDEDGERRVRMGNLAFVGSHTINGVSALHTELMKETVFADLHRLYPDRINNKTNGITPRRWLIQCNPGLTALAPRGDRRRASSTISKRWPTLDAFAGDAAFRERFAAVKRANKVRLASLVAERLGIRLDPVGAVRRPDQAHPRIQAPASQHHRGGRALRPDPLASRARLGAAGEDSSAARRRRAITTPS